MPIIKVVEKRKKNFTVVANALIKDDRLAMKEKGVLLTLLSLPETWNLTRTGLSKFCRDGPDSIKSALAKLAEAGYISKGRMRDRAGRLGDSVYYISDEPKFGNNAAVPAIKKPTL